MRQWLAFILVGFQSTLVFSSTPSDLTPWKLVSDEDGVKVYSREVAGSDVVAFRGEAEVAASVSKIVSVLTDTPHKKDWVAKLVEARDLKITSPIERIEYNHTAAGFPFVSDRDFVFKAWGEVDRSNRRFVVRLKSVEDPTVPPVNGLVRGHIADSAYFLTPIEDGTRTKLVIEIQADPRGSIPKFLVNSFQKHWPRKTIQGIRQQVVRADLVENPVVKEAVSTL